MIAIAMYILLGVFVTLLLALLSLPMIWRRAVRLTKKRILAEMPMSYSELQADKDMQRAEQAMELRRLEVTAETRLEDLSNHSLKADRLSKTLEERDTTIQERETEIASLKSNLTSQIDETTKTQSTLDETRSDLDTANDSITALKRTLSKLKEELLHLETSYSEQKVELVAQMTQIENYKEEVSELTSQRNAETNKRKETEGQLSQKTAEFDRSKERRDKQQEKLDQLQSEIADKDADISNLNRQLERALSKASETGSTDTSKLADAETRRVEAEAKIASLSLQLKHQETSEDGGDLSSLVDQMQKEYTDLESRLSNALHENETLHQKLQDATQEPEETESPLSSQESLLRDEIKNIAARITDVAAKAEGASSPIHALLEQGEEEKLASNGNAEETNGASETATADPWNDVFSLADRIRDMDKPAEDTQSNH